MGVPPGQSHVAGGRYDYDFPRWIWPLENYFVRRRD